MAAKSSRTDDAIDRDDPQLAPSIVQTAADPHIAADAEGEPSEEHRIGEKERPVTPFVRLVAVTEVAARPRRSKSSCRTIAVAQQVCVFRVCAPTVS